MAPPASALTLKPLLTWCGVSLGAYAGTLARYGLSFCRDGETPSQLGVLLANALGSFLLGGVSCWQHAWAPRCMTTACRPG